MSHMQEHPNYKYRPRRRKPTKRGGRRPNEILMPNQQPNGSSSIGINGNPHVNSNNGGSGDPFGSNSPFPGFHTPDASPNASPDPDNNNKDFRRGPLSGKF